MDGGGGGRGGSARRAHRPRGRGRHACRPLPRPPRPPLPSFRLGRQEDAHEYLIALLDAVHEACLARAPGAAPPPPALAATSLIYALFGGALRSTVTCSDCGYASATAEPSLCLSLDIGGADTVASALARFTAGDILDGDNRYRCPRQGGKRVRAVKSLAVDAAPRVLVLHLKRFSYAHGGRKLSQRVAYPETLDLAPYTLTQGGGGGGGASKKKQGGGAKALATPPPPPMLYTLTGVLVHSGHSLHCGHYTAFVRAGTGLWHCADDAHLAQVADRVALAQRAYILFYCRAVAGEAARGEGAPTARGVGVKAPATKGAGKKAATKRPAPAPAAPPATAAKAAKAGGAGKGKQRARCVRCGWSRGVEASEGG